jgi:hypothetical protein
LHQVVGDANARDADRRSPVLLGHQARDPNRPHEPLDALALDADATAMSRNALTGSPPGEEGCGFERERLDLPTRWIGAYPTL